MWRAYGSSSSVAIILNSEVFFSNLSNCIFLSKVNYGDASDFPLVLDNIINYYIEYKKLYPKGCGESEVFDVIENAFIERIISSRLRTH